MFNKKTIEEFNKDLDRIIQGKRLTKSARSQADTQALDIARRLEQTDFSASSKKHWQIRRQIATLADSKLDGQKASVSYSPRPMQVVPLAGLIILTAILIGLFVQNLSPQSGLSSQGGITAFAPLTNSPPSLSAPISHPTQNYLPAPQLIPTPGPSHAATSPVSSGFHPEPADTHLAQPLKIP